MAMGVYLGPGSLKELKSCYVGAGGVKTVSEIYVGVGGTAKKVWPSYIVGSQLFDFSTDNYLGYYTPISWSQDKEGSETHTIGSWTLGYLGVTTYDSGYMWCEWTNGIQRDCGAYISTSQQVNASALSYLGVAVWARDSHSSSASDPGYTFYVSVGSSTGTAPDSDSGNGSYSYLTGSTRSTSYVTPYRFLINLTGCTRTGYIKFEIKNTRNRTTDKTDWGEIILWDILVGNSTSISDYSFKRSEQSNWDSTITVT